MQASSAACAVDGCKRNDIRARGWCGFHYQRWYNHGDPLWERPSRRAVVRCDHCGEGFDVPASRVELGARFCSWACRKAGIRGRGNNRYVERVERVCLECAKPFESLPSHIKARGGHYCSKACLGIANGKRQAANNLFRSPLVQCLECDKVFSVPPSQLARKKFCSRKCAADGMRTASDYIYGPTWLKQRRKARERDNWTCQKCGSKENIHVHHKKPYRLSRSNALRNLVCLCASCHTKTEAALRAAERKAKYGTR